MSERQAQIEDEAASRYPEHGRDFLTGMTFHSFQRGAEWADANPYSTPEALVAAYEDGQRDAVEKGLANPQPATGDTSDGYHTFNELYEYRMLYNAHAAHGWLAQGIPVVKSWQHSDGQECFGGGWFVVVAELPAGQVSNHYRAEHWGLFKVPEVDLPPEWDGHTPHDAAMRLRAEAEHANPQPHTITRAQADRLLSEGVRVWASDDLSLSPFVKALATLGIEVTDDAG